jgi:hypothetical protein
MSDRRDFDDRRQRTDRRRTQRHLLDAEIRFLRSGGVPNAILGGELLDVSATGLRLAIDEPLSDGEKLLIEVRDHDQVCFNLTAAVVWTETNDAGEQTVGCELCVDLSPRQYARLRQLAALSRFAP